MRLQTRFKVAKIVFLVVNNKYICTIYIYSIYIDRNCLSNEIFKELLFLKHKGLLIKI